MKISSELSAADVSSAIVSLMAGRNESGAYSASVEGAVDSLALARAFAEQQSSCIPLPHPEHELIFVKLLATTTLQQVRKHAQQWLPQLCNPQARQLLLVIPTSCEDRHALEFCRYLDEFS